MKEVTGNIWDYHKQGNWIVITTNGNINKVGECIMGRGIALEAKKRFPLLPKQLGNTITEHGNHVHRFFCLYDFPDAPITKIITFPTKHNWWEKSDLALIERSCEELVDTVSMFLHNYELVYLVRPGCNNGQLEWKDVKLVLEKHLDNRFIIVDWGG